MQLTKILSLIAKQCYSQSLQHITYLFFKQLFNICYCQELCEAMKKEMIQMQSWPEETQSLQTNRQEKEFWRILMITQPIPCKYSEQLK